MLGRRFSVGASRDGSRWAKRPFTAQPDLVMLRISGSGGDGLVVGGRAAFSVTGEAVGGCATAPTACGAPWNCRIEAPHGARTPPAEAVDRQTKCMPPFT